MAITKIHAIKATVSGAVNYICDAKKTDSQVLITSYGTAPESAADDFRYTLSHTSGSDTNKAFHLIQSFAPGEVGAKEAHSIGIELADRLLEGRYSYIVSTHTDKGHIHNHIIFCAADNIDYKKYHDCKRSYWNIRRLNDEICEEHDLSVIKKNEGKSKQYSEWFSDKKGTSWKAKLKTDINDTIKQAHTYEEFIALMQAKGYEIKASEIVRFALQYNEKARYARNYKKSKDPERYYQAHAYDIHLAWGAAERLEKYGIDPETMNLPEIESRYEKLCSDRQRASDSYKEAERECKDLQAKRDSLLAFMGEDRSPEQERPRKQTRE